MTRVATGRYGAFARLPLLLLGSIVAACTWVEPTPQGKQVRLVPQDRVADCRQVGELSTFTKAQVAGVDRNADKVRQELDTLARNEAADMDADTIVATGPVRDGRRSYLAYRCL